MKIQQLSIFLENKPGHLDAACKALADAGIDLLTLNLADTSAFGILRIIVKEQDRAKSILEGKGFTVKLTDLIAAKVKDQPGGLHGILEVISGAGVNIEYMYAYAERSGDSAIMLLRVDQPDKALEVMQKSGIAVVSNSELFG